MLVASLWSDLQSQFSDSSLESTVVLSIRPFTTFLLSITLLLGHAPAWLHVATCNHDVCSHGRCDHGHSANHSHAHGDCGCESDPLKETVQWLDSLGSHTHDHRSDLHACESATPVSSPPDSLGTSSEYADESHSPHDSHSCWICQSLAAPNGLVDQSQSTINREWIELADWPICDSADAGLSISWPPLRGPPVIRA